jgi:glycosyltransferase involved in cell wall biosynthesis
VPPGERPAGAPILWVDPPSRPANVRWSFLGRLLVEELTRLGFPVLHVPHGIEPPGERSPLLVQPLAADYDPFWIQDALATVQARGLVTVGPLDEVRGLAHRPPLVPWWHWTESGPWSGPPAGLAAQLVHLPHTFRGEVAPGFAGQVGPTYAAHRFGPAPEAVRTRWRGYYGLLDRWSVLVCGSPRSPRQAAELAAALEALGRQVDGLLLVVVAPPGLRTGRGGGGARHTTWLPGGTVELAGEWTMEAGRNRILNAVDCLLLLDDDLEAACVTLEALATGLLPVRLGELAGPDPPGGGWGVRPAGGPPTGQRSPLEAELLVRARARTRWGDSFRSWLQGFAAADAAAGWGRLLTRPVVRPSDPGPAAGHRILWLASPAPPGAPAGEQGSLLCRQLGAAGFEPYLVCLGERTTWPHQARDGTHRILHLPWASPRQAGAGLVRAWIAQLHRQYRFAALIVDHALEDYTGLEDLGVPVLWWYGSGRDPVGAVSWERGRPPQWASSLLRLDEQDLVLSSPVDREVLAELLDPDRLQHIPVAFDEAVMGPDRAGARRNAATLAPALPAALAEKFVVGCLLDEREEDVLPALLAAWARLAAQPGRDSLLLVLTSDGGAARLREHLPSPGPATAGTFVLTGFLGAAERAVFYNLLDVLVVPSLAATAAPLVVEAQACGTPVVGLDRGWLHERLSGRGWPLAGQAAGAASGIQGWSLDPVELAEALDRLRHDETCRAQLGAQSRAAVEVHRARRVAERWAGRIESRLAVPTGPPSRATSVRRDILAFAESGLESLCGAGSSLDASREVRAFLARVIVDYGIRTLSDAPCGDLNWIRHMDLTGVDYRGYDLSRLLLNLGRSRKKDVQVSEFDLLTEILPKADLILCRDFLFLMPNDDILKVLELFKRSGSTYLMTTTFDWLEENRDSTSGVSGVSHGFRFLNLHLSPFNFPPCLDKIVEQDASCGGRSVGLWRLEEILV